MGILRKKFKGLSLLEVMVSMGVFSLMMVSVAGIFSSSISSYRFNKVIERDLENAQFVMNDIAKQLRTSTVVNPSTGTFASPETNDHVRFYDYSQGRCIQYTTSIDPNDNHHLSVASATVALMSDCATAPLDTPQFLTTGDVVPTFRVVNSFLDPVTPSNSRVGRVTMVFVVKEKSAATRSVTLQTTVSLRDYVVSGIVH